MKTRAKCPCEISFFSLENFVCSHYPRYDTIYDTAEKCQTACLTKVPQCNTVNYSPYVSGDVCNNNKKGPLTDAVVYNRGA